MNLSVEQEAFEVACKIFGTTYFVITNLPSDNLLASHICAVIFNVILIISTLILNAVAITTIWKSSQMNSKTCYFVVLIQSVIDLIVGVFGIPFFVMFLMNGITKILNCFVATLALRWTIYLISLSTDMLIAMTLERYIAILHPYAYSTLVTKKRLLIFVCFGSSLELPLHILFLAVNGLLMKYASIKGALTFAFITFAYARIYLIVRALGRSGNIMHNARSGEHLTRRKLFLQDMKQARSCFIVVVCFFVLGILPTPIANLVFQGLDKFGELKISVWGTTLALCISSVDSIIFFWTKTMLRKEAAKMLKTVCSLSKELHTHYV